jgi:hypothetical protein
MSLIFPQLFKALKEEGLTKADIASALQINVEQLDKLVFGLIILALDGGAGGPVRSTGKHSLQLIK